MSRSLLADITRVLLNECPLPVMWTRPEPMLFELWVKVVEAEDRVAGTRKMNDDYKQARGSVGGSEPAEIIIRRLRDGVG